MAQPRRHRAMREILDAVRSESGAVDPDSFTALHGSIVGQTLKPTAHGGAGGDIEQYLADVHELAVHDGSLGWLAAVFNAAALEVAELGSHVADDVWGPDAKALITRAYRGEAAVSDGVQVTGRWHAVVGAGYADWLLLPVGDDLVLVTRQAANVEPVATHNGLRFAGVCDVAIAGAAIADRHVFRRAVAVVAGAGAAAAVVGSADGVWRKHVEQLRARLATSYGGEEVTDAVAAQVAWAASDIDAARLQIATAVDDPDEADPTWSYRQAVARAGAAADRLLGSSRHALDASDPVAGRWRDVHTGIRLAVPLLEDDPAVHRG
jgi:3-hydroxy-9,10-secoandrosta-1,3,5(10)-triene-9,17-dione monooxygenase